MQTPPAAELEAFLLHLADVAAAPALSAFRHAVAVENKRATPTGASAPGAVPNSERQPAGEAAFDPVTEADRAIERVLRTEIERAYPDHGIFGEEYGIVRSQSEMRWVLDPIDGTRAFMAGFPTWGTLAGLMIARRAVAGLMSQPFTGEVYVAVSGHCATARHARHSVPLATRTDAPAGRFVISTTSPDLFSVSERAAFDRVRERAQIVRYGGDCYAYAQLAAGRVDAVIEAGLQAYDIVPLIAIIEQAGGVVTTWTGQSASEGGRILASANAALHADLMDVLADV